jgi:serine/threonine-protein kinase
MPLNPGEIIDSKYEILERLGAGGMGEVYKVAHTWLGATRVIKVVHPQISGNEDAKARFLREAQAATKVQHPSVATLHDFSGLPDGSHYMVWEYIDGENLAQRLRTRGTLPPREAVQIVIQALHGLEAIHRAGIIHRDISPENLMITRDNTVKIIDLGVAKVEGTSEVASTRTGIFVGKLRYASPEQLGFIPDGAKIDARTDLYSIGMVLYELLTGRPPYEAKSPHEYFLLHARDEQNQKSVELPLDMPGGPGLRQVLDRALERDRNRRFSSAAEFAAALEEVEASLEADDTMRVAPRTVRMNRPVPPAAATTVRTPMPAPLPQSATPASRSMLPLLAVIAVVCLVTIGGIAAVFFWPKKSDQAPAVNQPVASNTAATAPPAQPAEGSVSVVTTTTAPTETTVTTAPYEPVATPPPLRKGEVVAVQTTEPVAAPEPVRNAVASDGPAFVDGGGDEDANERMLEQLRREAAGVRRVEVHGGAMQNELVKALKEEFPKLEIADSAPVVIRFEGVLERLGRGRKRRGATATITKNGRVIFRYQMPEEVFRVGMTPPEAFVRVLTDAVEVE